MQMFIIMTQLGQEAGSKQKRSFFECEEQDNQEPTVRVCELNPLPIEEVRRTCFWRSVCVTGQGSETVRHVRTRERYLNFELCVGGPL